jgi:hypothetical protein
VRRGPGISGPFGTPRATEPPPPPPGHQGTSEGQSLQRPDPTHLGIAGRWRPGARRFLNPGRPGARPQPGARRPPRPSSRGSGSSRAPPRGTAHPPARDPAAIGRGGHLPQGEGLGFPTWKMGTWSPERRQAGWTGLWLELPLRLGLALGLGPETVTSSVRDIRAQRWSRVAAGPTWTG